ncbi:hypothetical protein [Hydrocarboniphaga sp.]|uniref:hypothetical protein n=1 Tax=Hydrocarboniphaga sp. TaxID=2033016 RepID=UPI002608FBAC|nr:hypothetical protein [Hydrocarboniphaga sp.]
MFSLTAPLTRQRTVLLVTSSFSFNLIVAISQLEIDLASIDYHAQAYVQKPSPHFVCVPAAGTKSTDAVHAGYAKTS